MEHETRSERPLAPGASDWVALRPSLKLNCRRFVAMPLGAALGVGAGLVIAATYHLSGSVPLIVGGIVALWVWLQFCIGPLFLTVLYADNNWVGERGLWKRNGIKADHLVYVTCDRNYPILLWDPSKSKQRPHYFAVNPRLRWSREQLAALASFVGVPTYGIWPVPGRIEPLKDLATDPVPVPHLESLDDIGNAIARGVHR